MLCSVPTGYTVDREIFMLEIIGVKFFQCVLFSLVDPSAKFFQHENFRMRHTPHMWLQTLDDDGQLINGTSMEVARDSKEPLG